MTKLESLTAMELGGKVLRRWTTRRAEGRVRSWAVVERMETSMSLVGVFGGGSREEDAERLEVEGEGEVEEVSLWV